MQPTLAIAAAFVGCIKKTDASIKVGIRNFSTSALPYTIILLRDVKHILKRFPSADIDWN